MRLVNGWGIRLATSTLIDEQVRAPSKLGSTLLPGLAIYVVAVVGTVGAIIVWLGGTFVYVLDDPAIHLSIADNLAHHGVWGVDSNGFQSASSSPLWTLLVTGGITLPGPDQWVPLILNVLAGVTVVAILAPRMRSLGLFGTGVVVVAALFLPGLAVVGMEHTLHMALVLAVVVLVQERPQRIPAWLPYALLVAATLTRFETLFIAFGLAVGTLAERRRREAVMLFGTSAATFVSFGVANRLMGGGWLPNSILAKGNGPGAANTHSQGIGPDDVIGRLADDPLVAALFAVAVGYLFLVAPSSGAVRITSWTLVVGTSLHVVFADIGWYQRYQAYLIAVGVYLTMRILSSLPADVHRRARYAFLALLVVFAMPKVSLLTRVPRAADDMYRQQYQAARFLSSAYAGQPIATDQLGYISYFHEGPTTDLVGLGDYEVLRDRPKTRRGIKEYWADLADARGFPVAVLYDSSRVGVPDSWVLAGTFEIDGRPATAVTSRLQFWATRPDEVDALQEGLEQFSEDLPDRMRLDLNDWAELQAAE